MFASLRAQCVRITNSLLDVIFPPTERDKRVRNYQAESLPLAPMQHEACGIRITTLSPYHHKAFEDTIRALKYEKSGAAADLLAALFADYLLEELAEESLFSAEKLVLVPMPLARGRERERGYNQISLVLTRLTQHGVTLPIRPDLLARTRETPQQTRLSRKERLKNVAGAFSVPSEAPAKGLRILLIDDVTTTGATLAEAAKTLAKSGAKVTPLAFGRA